MIDLNDYLRQVHFYDQLSAMSIGIMPDWLRWEVMHHEKLNKIHLRFDKHEYKSCHQIMLKYCNRSLAAPDVDAIYARMLDLRDRLGLTNVVHTSYLKDKV